MHYANVCKLGRLHLITFTKAEEKLRFWKLATYISNIFLFSLINPHKVIKLKAEGNLFQEKTLPNFSFRRPQHMLSDQKRKRNPRLEVIFII